MHTALQSHALQSLQSFLLVGHAVEILRQHDVFQRREIGNQMKLLEDKTNLLCPNPVQFRGRHACDILAIEPDFAGSGPVEAANQIH